MFEESLRNALQHGAWKPPPVTAANFDERSQPGEFKPQYIILHCIGFQRTKALALLTEEITQTISAHFFIDQAGECISLMPLDRIAKHCGQSYWRGQHNLNPYAIGIELHSPDYAGAITQPNNLDWYHHDHYTEPQLITLIKLLNYLKKRFNIIKDNILFHSDIAPWRLNDEGEIVLGKTDPGITFPAKLFAKMGFGWWPNGLALSELNAFSIIALQRYLLMLGYRIKLTGEKDSQTHYVLLAYLMHFYPQEFNEYRKSINSNISQK